MLPVLFVYVAVNPAALRAEFGQINGIQGLMKQIQPSHPHAQTQTP